MTFLKKSHSVGVNAWPSGLRANGLTMKLSIVIPARNEAGCIQATVTGLRDTLDSAGISDLEILVVDDGSTDGTYEVVKAEEARDPRIRVIRNNGKHGFGRAVIYGLNEFTGDAVI